jgi:hypothetical protein
MNVNDMQTIMAASQLLKEMNSFLILKTHLHLSVDFIDFFKEFLAASVECGQPISVRSREETDKIEFIKRLT